MYAPLLDQIMRRVSGQVLVATDTMQKLLEAVGRAFRISGRLCCASIVDFVAVRFVKCGGGSGARRGPPQLVPLGRD